MTRHGEPSPEARARGATLRRYGLGRCRTCGCAMHEIDAPECPFFVAVCDADETHVEEWLPWPG